MPRVIHFEISVDEPEKAIKFYEEVFGWKFKKWEGPMEYWIIYTGEKGEPGIDGGLMLKKDSSGDHNTIGVEDVDEYVKKIEEAGGTIVVPKKPIPGVGNIAFFKDAEGNVFGIMDEDKEAK